MTQNPDTTLFAEEEIRTAIRELRPDSASFEVGVRERMELANRLPDQQANSESDMLCVAASVVPLPLLSLGRTSQLIGSVGKVSFGKKLVGVMALPAITLVFAIGGTIAAMFFARKATGPDATANAATDPLGTMATNRWWRRHGLVAVVVFAISLLAPLLGLTVPLLFVYGLSGIAMVSLMSTLAREGLVSRGAICGSAIPGLGILGQIGIMSDSNTTHLLDQTVLLAVLYFGMGILGLLMLPFLGRSLLAAAKASNGRVLNVFLVVLLFITGSVVVQGTQVLLRSLWDPATQQTMHQYVENFDSAPYGSSSWNRWEIPAKWLVDSGADVDWTKPKTLLKTDQVGRNDAVLVSALRTGLLQAGDIEPATLDKARETLRRAVSNFYRTRPFSFIPEFEIRALTVHGELTDETRDILKTRLILKFQKLDIDAHNVLIRCNTLVQLMDVVNRPIDLAAHRDRVHRLLIELQQDTGGGFQFAGGFASSKTLAHPDEPSTAAAIKLMERFGVPKQVDILAVRSYVRRRNSDLALPQRAASNTAMRLRIDNLADVPSLTWWDYVRCEQNLCLTILFIVLCIYCAAIAPTTPIPVCRTKPDSN